MVQRVPVRIALDAQELAAHPLKIGLSMRVAVDTRQRGGLLAASTPSGRPAWRTAVFDGELAQAAEQAEAVIAANLGRSR